MRSCYRILLGLLLSMLFFTDAMTQNVGRNLRFVRVKERQELRSGDIFLIGGQQKEGGKTSFSFLKAQLNKAGKAIAVGYGENFPSQLTLSETSAEALLWKVTLLDDSTLYLWHKGNYLDSHNPKKATSLQLTAQKGTPWNFSLQGSVLICRKNDRFLGLAAAPQANGSIHYHYGAYKKGYAQEALALYRMAHIFDELEGSAVLPLFSQPITLTNASHVALATGEATAKNDYLLSDSSLAQKEHLLRCVAEQQDATTFSLRPLATGTMPDFLAAVPTWQLLHHHIATKEASPRYLFFYEGRLQLLTAEQAQEKEVEDVLFSRIAPVAQTETKGFTLTLKGGWTKNDWEQLSFAVPLEIDVTAATLPLDFSPRTNEWRENTLVRLSSSQRSLAKMFPFVVCEDTLQQPFTFTDKAPYGFSRPFYADKAMLSYRRTIYNDEGWETLCLPFTAAVPQAIRSERLVERSATQLTFSPTDTLKAGSPLIFRSKLKKTDKKVTLTWSNEAGMVRLPQAELGFVGTHQPLTVDGNSAFYFLNDQGSLFLRAAQGSALSPFRAYFEGDSKTALSLKHIVTALHTPFSPLLKNNVLYYDLLGRPYKRKKKGLLLQKGNKIIITNDHTL